MACRSPATSRRITWRSPTSGSPARDGSPGRLDRTAIRGATTRSSPRRSTLSLRVNPPLRTPADALACLTALADGTIDAIATDHAPHTEVDKAVEFGLAANGISGIETAIGLVLAAVDAGQLTLARAVEALTIGPARLLGTRTRRVGGVGLVEGAPADLVVIDRSASWTVTSTTLASRGKNSPLLGRDLPGRVLLTMAAGRVAYEAEAD